MKFKLAEADFLEYHLYSYTISPYHQKRVKRFQIATPLLFLGLGFILFNNRVAFISYVILAVLSFFLFPMIAKAIYKRSMTKYIEQSYQERLEKDIEITIDKDFLYSKNEVSEGKYKTKALKDFTETPNHYFVRLISDVCHIIPKRAIDNNENFRSSLQSFGIPYVNKTDWKW